MSTLIEKLELCCAHRCGCALFEDVLTDPPSDVKYMKEKTAALKEVLEYVATHIGVVTEAMYPDFFHLFKCNVFRPLPPSSTPKKKVRRRKKTCDERELQVLEDTIYDLEESMDDLKEELEEMMESINYVGNQDIENLEQQMGDLEENIDNLKEEIDYIIFLNKADCPHLYLIYSIFLKFLDSPDLDVNMAINHIDQNFLLQLFELFNSEDHRERVFVMKTLHLMYGLFLDLRECIFKTINNIFFRFIYETEKQKGIVELLQISECIIKGFDIPLKEDHKVFLLKVLMPLHQKSDASIHIKLVDCVRQFLIKQPSLIESVVNSLLRYWPKTNCTKELIFMQESVEILNDIPSAELTNVIIPLFKRYAKCISSANFQVANYGLQCILCFLNNENTINVINDNATVLSLTLISSIKNSKSHWNDNFQLSADIVLETLKNVNQDLYEECLKNYEHHQQSEKAKMEEREKNWENIKTLAINNLAFKRAAPSESVERSIGR